MAGLVLWTTVFVTSCLAITLPSQPSVFSCDNTSAANLGCSCRTEDSILQVKCSRRNLTVLPPDLTLPLFTRHLDLSKNSISSLAGPPFSHLYGLENLILSWNRLTVLPEDTLANLTYLRVLDLSHNLLKELPRTLFQGTSRLQKLDLAFNGLSSLDPDMLKDLPNLDELHLSGNLNLGRFLMDAPDTLSVVFNTGLRYLAADNLNLTHVPEGFFSEAASLRHLSMADNPLSVVPYLPPSLESLNFSGCHFKRLTSGRFVAVPFLQTLVLDRLKYLSEVQAYAFEGLTSLDVLSMERCANLRTFHGRAFGEFGPNVCSVRRLSLALCGLRELPQEVFVDLKRLEVLNLQGNPWHCDCRLAWLRGVNMSEKETQELRCFSPPHLRNKPLMSVNLTHFTCQEGLAHHEQRRHVVISLLIVLCLIGGAGVAALSYRRARSIVARWWESRPETLGPAARGYELIKIEPNKVEQEDSFVWATASSSSPPSTSAATEKT
uniref:(California timema) hypothetical protein n=2 Tax=Timema TaxID=61471 RepID=A0A7R9PCJ3_TIMCA|nr:unnamed protein product [Timema californicum]